MTTRISSRYGLLAVQFGKFGLVGVVGLVVDTAVVYALLPLGLKFFVARIPAFLCAATATWALNRSFTFRTSLRRPLIREWATFLATNAVGGVVNYAVSVALVAGIDFVATHPVLAVAAGSLAGMFFNFAASKRLVFKEA